MEGQGFPKPPEDLGISEDTLRFVNSALSDGDLQVYSFHCENCGYRERRLESAGASKTVYCPTEDGYALRRSLA